MAESLLGSRAFLLPPSPAARRAERLDLEMSPTESQTGAPTRTPNKTFVMTKAQAQGTRAWWVVDASGKPLGRLASEVAHVLRGKHKPQYTPHEDTGDFVVIVNADKVLLTGGKLDKKFY